MVPNLLEGFSDWMKQHVNVGSEDFADIGNIILSPSQLKSDDDDDEKSSDDEDQPNDQPIIFKVSRNEDGTSYKLVAQGGKDPHDSDKADFPHSGSSDDEGKEYLLSKEEFEKLQMFPKSAAGGMGGMGGGLGM